MGVVEIYKVQCEGTCGRYVADMTRGHVTMKRRTAQTFPSKAAAEGARERAFLGTGRCTRCR